MLASMKRTAPIEGASLGGGAADAGSSVTLDSYGYTMSSKQVWWNPETQEKYTFHTSAAYPEGCFRPYDGPVIFGTGYTF